MKCSNVETSAQFPGSFRAQLFDLQLANFVSERLPRPNDVTVYFDDDVVFSFRRVLFHEIDRLLAAPTKLVHPGIYNQTASAPHLISQLPELRIRIGIETHLGSKAFGVQTPPFDISRVSPVAPKIRQTFEL